MAPVLDRVAAALGGRGVRVVKFDTDEPGSTLADRLRIERSCLCNIANALQALGDFSRAVQCQKRCLKLALDARDATLARTARGNLEVSILSELDAQLPADSQEQAAMRRQVDELEQQNSALKKDLAQGRVGVLAQMGHQFNHVMRQARSGAHGGPSQRVERCRTR